MTGGEKGIRKLLRQDPRLDLLVERIRAIGAPGDFHASGRDFAPMPKISVGAIETLSFPIPREQIRALVAEAEPAPYGRGLETLVDPEVRNSFQIAPERVRISSPRWSEVFGQVLEGTTRALGCAMGSLAAELYKLVVYEPGGFFLSHRDTEKAPGMVATLVIALPTAGAGGELLVRHRGREAVVAMQTDHPSELIHAAFYADCQHEIRPVTAGARVALVYNLIRRAEGALEAPPDHEALVASVAAELGEQFARSDGPEKLVWILEHEYSKAGLSFQTLKNVDDGVGRVLLDAADRAGCSIHAALLQGSESSHVMPWTYGDEIPDPGDHEYEVTEVDDWSFWLSGFRRPEGTSPLPERLYVEAGELLPEGSIDPEEPSSRTLFEATGNGGATVELLYERAALVLWPWSATMTVLAPAGAEAMEAFLTNQTRAGADPAALAQLAAHAAACWPAPSPYDSDTTRWRTATGRALERIDRAGSPATTKRFLERNILPHYGKAMNPGLVAVAARCGPDALASPLRALVRARAADAGPGVIGLVEALARRVAEAGTDAVWAEALRSLAREVAQCVARGKADPEPAAAGTRRRRRSPLRGRDLATLCELSWVFDLDAAVADSIGNLLRDRKVSPPPERAAAAAVVRLWERSPARCRGSGSFRLLWKWVARFLLARSSAPPDTPADWVTPSKGVGCSRCALCRELRAFCADPAASEHRFVRKQSDRSHVEEEIRRNPEFRLRTLKRGRPYTLIITKTRAGHENRLRQYAGDVRDLRALLRAAGGVAGSGSLSSAIAAAIERADVAASG